MANDRSEGTTAAAGTPGPAPTVGQPSGSSVAGERHAVRGRRIPAWLRLVAAIWAICLLLIGFQQLGLQLFVLLSGN